MADNDSTLVEAEAVLQTGAFVLPFECIGMGDVAIVGGKNASLGELIGTLGAQAIRVPDGFATTADAYRLHISSNGIEPRIRDLLASLHAGEKSLRDAGAEIRTLILAGTLPPPVEQQLRDAYCELGR
jgi:pyruvate,water dikinase